MTEFEIDFRPNGNSARYVGEGWGDPESFGRWMVGRQSLLTLPAPPYAQGGFRVVAIVGPYLAAGRVAAQHLRILINGAEAHSVRLTGVVTVDFVTPDSLIGTDRDIEIRFVHPDAVAPRTLAAGDDLRELALSIWSLTLFGPARPAESAGPARDGPPVWQVRSRGNLANRMIQYMVALRVQARTDCTLSGVALDEWGLSTEAEAPGWADHAVVDEQFLDLDATTALLARPDTRKIAYRGYGQRMANFPPLDTCRAAFAPVTDNIVAYDERYLVINVRGGEIVAGHAAMYVLIPPSFYRDLIARTGLIPVFVGQLEPNAYTTLLRAAFPSAQFVMSQGPMRDFETLRRAQNLVVAVSTFSWLAAWLSHARKIHLPVNGLFNPAQVPPVDLLPTDDPRYEFYLFPVNGAVPPAELPNAMAALEGTWRPIAAAELCRSQPHHVAG